MNIDFQPYKGTRDFYPHQWRLQNYIFSKWSQVAESYGYERYEASVLEYLNIYKLKNQTNLEILDKQIYSFTDRGRRQVALRPEMTPTVARMVAKHRLELNYPVRWYSIPNLWRYERPQKGRLREHWQLNVDIFGLNTLEAEFELILIIKDLLHSFGAKEPMYQIHLSSRGLLQNLLQDYLALNPKQIQKLIILIDRYHKMEISEFKKLCQPVLSQAAVDFESIFQQLVDLINLKDFNQLPEPVLNWPSVLELKKLFDDLRAALVTNVVLDLTLVRGFSYYTGIVFEIFDQSEDNNRSMIGGGRYDDLLKSFKVQPLTGAGFGMGDVTLIEFLNNHQLLPSFPPPLDLYVILSEEVDYYQILNIVQQLRKAGLKTFVDSRPLKFSKKLETALKKEIVYALFIGPQELKEQLFNLKHLPSQQETRLSLERIISKLVAV